jgi:phospholipase/carboxylesterase
MKPHRSEQRQYGPLQCIELLAGAEPRLLLVLCHGYGAPGEDLYPLALELLELVPEDATTGIRCLLPAAPLSPIEFRPFGGRAWWPLDLERIVEQIASGDLQSLTQREPAGLPEARATLTAFLNAAGSDRATPLVLGGFSQGAMLATDTALRGELPTPSGLLLYSGSLLCASDWIANQSRLTGCPVVQSHGRTDPILPYAAGLALNELLKGGGAETEFVSFSDGHTIPFEALEPSARLLGRLLASTASPDQ